jgi:hypothetical protein
MSDENAELRNLLENESVKEAVWQEQRLLDEIAEAIDEALMQIRKGDLDLRQGAAILERCAKQMTEFPEGDL